MTDAGDEWENERVEVTYEAVRSVLDAQNNTMSDIDAKAMRTVRLNTLLVGVLVAVARFAGSGVFERRLLYLSIASLVASTVLGVVTYNESDLYVGPSGDYAERLIRGETGGKRWDQNLLETFAGMTSENADVLDWNSWLLTTTQGALVVGIIGGSLAAFI